MRSGKNKAVFIDKDGTLIKDVPYNVNPDLIVLEKGAVDGLKVLQHENYLLVIITNQSGVARGYFNIGELEHVKQKIMELLHEHDIVLNGFYFCPHHAAGTVAEYSIDCECRKPKPGMILKAIADLNIDPSASWMIGDILHDMEAGNRAGCRTVLIDNGNETEWIMTEIRTPDFIAGDIEKAAAFIVNQTI